MRYFEDFTPGQTFRSRGTALVEPEAIKTFAASFDPQPFHLEEAAADRSFFGGLVASGWHTAGLTMRLLVEGELEPAGGVIGAGVEALRWPTATRPGDVLGCVSEVLETRPSAKRPELGLLRLETTTTNQRGEVVQVFTCTLIVPRRTAGG